MFRPLEAIFRLHKIELEERDIINIVCAMAFIHCCAHYMYYIPLFLLYFVSPEDGF